MTGDLTTMLLDSLDKEARRFASEHPGDDAPLYERAIAPRRAMRRAVTAVAAVVAVGVVAVGAFALNVSRPPDEVAPPAVSPSATEIERAAQVWGPSRRADEPAVSLEDAWGAGPADAPTCAALDAYAALGGWPERGGTPVALGTIAGTEGGADSVHARAFPSASDATAYLDAFLVDATRCASEAQATGDAAVADVAVAEVGIAQIGGTGVRVDVTPAAGDGIAWRLWIYVDEAEALAVAGEPALRQRASMTVREWFTAPSR